MINPAEKLKRKQDLVREFIELLYEYYNASCDYSDIICSEDYDEKKDKIFYNKAYKKLEKTEKEIVEFFKNSIKE